MSDRSSSKVSSGSCSHEEAGETPRHAVPEPTVDIRNLTFQYPAKAGNPRFGLRLPSLTAAAGERMALYGPSGCGKSTLLDLIAGILRADTGTVNIAGAELGAMTEAERRSHRIRHIGFVFQDFPLVEYLDAFDNVLLPFRLTRDLKLDSQARGRARDLLTELGLPGYERRRPHELSQGERQRLAIARALVTDPCLLLADEPTAGLDPHRSQKTLDLLEEICSQHRLTLLLVSHEPAVLERFDHRLNVQELVVESAS